MSKFFKGVHREEILLGHIYTTVIPFTTPQPLKLYESCSICSNKQICKNVSDKCGKVVECDRELDWEVIQNVQDDMDRIPVVIFHKVRPAVVIQPNLYNAREDYPYVFVAPIQTLHKEKMDAKKLEKFVSNKIPQVYYIGDHTGHESYVSVSDIKRLHKSYLLEKHDSDPLDEETIQQIYIKIGDLLGMGKGKISACKTCEANCDNCELKKISSATVVNK